MFPTALESFTFNENLTFAFAFVTVLYGPIDPSSTQVLKLTKNLRLDLSPLGARQLATALQQIDRVDIGRLTSTAIQTFLCFLGNVDHSSFVSGRVVGAIAVVVSMGAIGGCAARLLLLEEGELFVTHCIHDIYRREIGYRDMIERYR